MLRFSKLYNLNPTVVLSIIKVESDFHPYAVNVNYKRGYLSFNPSSYYTAVKIAYRYGSNVDLGYMQVNYKYWGKRFGLSKMELLKPSVNIQAGCYILYLLLKKYKTYTKAVKYYHSSNYNLGTRYMFKVARIYKQFTGSN